MHGKLSSANWEKKTGRKVKGVQFDGAGELGGCIEFFDELAFEGIEVEVVAAHEHWKNGRIERPGAAAVEGHQPYYAGE